MKRTKKSNSRLLNESFEDPRVQTLHNKQQIRKNTQSISFSAPGKIQGLRDGLKKREMTDLGLRLFL